MALARRMKKRVGKSMTGVNGANRWIFAKPKVLIHFAFELFARVLIQLITGSLVLVRHLTNSLLHPQCHDSSREHYFNMLADASPSGWTLFVTILVVVLSIIAFFVLSSFIEEEEKPPAGCRRLGIHGYSNLVDQYEYDPKDYPTWSIKALMIHPVKSCAPVELEKAEVVRTGLRYDRQFSFAQLVSPLPHKGDNGSHKVDHQWRFITQREFPLLAKVKTELWVPDPEARGYTANAKYVQSGGCIVLSFPFSPVLGISLQGWRNALLLLKAKWISFTFTAEPRISFRVPFDLTPDAERSNKYTSEQMIIWKEYPHVLNFGVEIPKDTTAKLKYFLGVRNPLTLFRTDPRQYREVYRCAPTKADIGYQPIVGLADAYPLHVLSLPSVREVESQLPSTEAIPLDIRRFRGNVIVSGPIPFAEDNWARMRIVTDTKNESVPLLNEYHISCRTARCKLPNVDPETGRRSVNEPYVSMSRYRRIDEGAQPYPCLGMQSCPMWDAGHGSSEDGSGTSGWIHVGDAVQVIEEKNTHYYIKQ